MEDALYLFGGARRSPDASWIAQARVDALPAEQRDHLWRIAPDFVIELRSPSDRPHLLTATMGEWLENGVRLGWLIDPYDRTVSVYRPGLEPLLLAEPKAVAGEGPIEGFTLDLTEIW